MYLVNRCYIICKIMTSVQWNGLQFFKLAYQTFLHYDLDFLVQPILRITRSLSASSSLKNRTTILETTLKNKGILFNKPR